MRRHSAGQLQACPTPAARVANLHKLAWLKLTVHSSAETVTVMKLSISAELELASPSIVRGGFVTWFDVRITEEDRVLGTARVALVHVGEMADAHGDLWPALRGTRLEPIHDVYFTDGWYKDDYADGAGIDLLYVDAIDLDASVQDKNLDLAIVRRLADTLASGCQLVVRAYTSPREAAHWAQIGFSVSTGGRGAGYMHMKLGYRHAELVDTSGSGDYRVLPSTGPSGDAPN